MALIHCPECQNEISDRADFCPHCGLPFVESTPEKNSVYELKTGTVREDGFAKFFQVLAWIFWIGGLIVSIIGANVVVSVDRWGDAKTEFSFTQFLTLFLTYLLYGGLAYGMSTVLQKFSGIYDILHGLHLSRKEEEVKIKKISPDQILMQERVRKAREEEEKNKRMEQEKEEAASRKMTDAAASCDEKEASFLKNAKLTRTLAGIMAEWKRCRLDKYYPEISEWLEEAGKQGEQTPEYIRTVKETLAAKITEEGGHRSALIIRFFSEEEAEKIVNELCDRKFGKKPNGYSFKEVNDYLNLICDEIEEKSANPGLINDSMLRRDQVLGKEFSRTEPGYDINEVKAYLKEIAEKYYLD